MKISNFKKFIFIAFSAVIFFIACEKENSVDDNFAIVSVFACGSTGKSTDIPTTKLIFTVNDDKFALTADDIKISAAFFVIKGKLKQEGTTCELPITPGGTGTIRVGLDPYRGFTGWSAKTVIVYADNYFSGTSELTITGSRDSQSNGVLNIPNEINDMPVTAIGDSAFVRKELISVNIPDSIKIIGDSAFAHNQLPEIKIPDSVFSIGNTAFAYNQLSDVIIPNSVTTIGSGAFGYNQLSAVTIPENITVIRSSVFAYNKITEIDIPITVTTIGTDAFTDNLLSDIDIPYNVTSIGNGAFAYNYLTKITIPEKISFLSGFNNNLLTEVEIHSTLVTSIGSSAFANNQLKNFDIPESVTIIGNYAFAHNLFESITIPEKVTDIGYRAFAYNYLSEIVIPDSVRNIEIHAFIDNPLTSITIGENVTLGTSSFGNGFENFYYKNSRKKGIYTFTGEWDYSPIPPIP